MDAEPAEEKSDSRSNLELCESGIVAIFVVLLGGVALCMLMPFIASQLCDRLPSPNGESSVDCSSLSSMPNVSFTIGGKVFDLAPEQVWFYAYFSGI